MINWLVALSLLVLGVASVLYGVAQWSTPAAYIIGGLSCLVIAVLAIDLGDEGDE